MVTAGGPGTGLGVNTGDIRVTPEVIYGMVFKYVGSDCTNFGLATSLGATTSEHTGR